MTKSKLITMELSGLIKFQTSAFLLYSIASIFSVCLRIKGFQANSKFLFDSFLLGSFITAFTLVLLLLGFKLIGQLQWKIGDFWAGPLFLLPAVGAIRGVVLHFEIIFFGFTNRISLVNSALSSMIYTSIFYGGSSILVSLLLRKNQLFQNEFQQAAFHRLKAQVNLDPNLGNVSYESTMHAINDAIKSKAINYGNLEEVQIRQISEEIKFQIQYVLRPLSHRLWIDSFGSIRIGKPSEILKDAITELHFSKVFIVAYQFIIGIFGIGISIGLLNGILKSIFATITSVILFYIFEKVWIKYRGSHFSSSLVFLFSVGLFPVLASEFFSSLIGIPVDFLAGAIIAPALPAILLVSAVYGMISRDKDFALSAARSIKSNVIRGVTFDEYSRDTKELSEYLHNTLQSELIRISKHLELTKNPAEAEIYINELHSALMRTREEVNSMRKMGLERLIDVCRSWEGIADISLSTKNLEDIPEKKVAEISSFLEEVISNSVRYGEATVMHISLCGVTDRVKIVVEHNGSKIVRGGKGLGSLALLTLGEDLPTITYTKAGINISLIA